MNIKSGRDINGVGGMKNDATGDSNTHRNITIIMFLRLTRRLDSKNIFMRKFFCSLLLRIISLLCDKNDKVDAERSTNV